MKTVCTMYSMCIHSGGEQFCGVRPWKCKKTRSGINWTVSRWNHHHRSRYHHCGCLFQFQFQFQFQFLFILCIRVMLQLQKILLLLQLLFRSGKWRLLLLQLLICSVHGGDLFTLYPSGDSTS